MFNGDLHGDWRWMPLILIFGAIAFMFFDPLGMEESVVTYVINAPAAAPVDPVPPGPVVPPGQIPPPGGGNPPPVAGFPTYETTGPQTAPTQDYAGPMIVNTNGVTIDNVVIRGCLQIIAADVTISNSRIEGNCPGAPVIAHVEGTNLQVLNNELIGVKVGTGIPSTGVNCGNCTVQGNNVRGTADGFTLRDGAQAIGNHIGQLGGGIVNGNPTRNVGFHIENGNGVAVRGNTVDSDCGLSRQDAGGQGVCDGGVQLLVAVGAATIEGNYFQRWNGPAESVTSTIIANGATNVRVLTNTFGNVPPAYCALQNGGTITEWTGNVLENNAEAARNC